MKLLESWTLRVDKLLSIERNRKCQYYILSIVCPTSFVYLCYKNWRPQRMISVALKQSQKTSACKTLTFKVFYMCIYSKICFTALLPDHLLTCPKSLFPWITFCKFSLFQFDWQFGFKRLASQWSTGARFPYTYERKFG